MAERSRIDTAGVSADLLHGAARTEDSEPLPQHMSHRFRHDDIDRIHDTTGRATGPMP